MNYRNGLFILLLAIIPAVAFCQSDHQAFYQQSQQINNNGMYVLGSWALVNIATGAYGWANGSGANKYFNQMNLFWNLVNLSIAGFALINNYQTDYMAMGPDALMERHLKMERLYLINAGIDILYIGTGAWLAHLSNSKEKNKDLLKGYGNSIMLQGGFLFIFDTIMYFLQHSRSTRFLEGINMDLSLGFCAVQCTIILK
jgi:hypothetical protein